MRAPQDDPPEGLRDRKKRDTRERLITAAADLFATMGFDETTTNHIAAAADVSQRTLFRYFPTKEAVLYGDMDDLRLELRAALAARPADEAVIDMVRESMLSLAGDFSRHRDRRLLQARLAASSPAVSAYTRAVVQASWEREIIAAVARRLDVDPVDDPRPEIVAGAAMSAIRVAMRQWTTGDARADFVDLAHRSLLALSTLNPAAA